MILKRISTALKSQNWLTVSIEFILVILGILIALAIDDWQTERNNNVQEQDYYCQVLNDFKLDRIQIDEKRSEARIAIKSGKQFISELNTFENDKDTLLALFIKAVRSYPYTPIDATYKDLTSSGDLRLLRRQSLKKSIITFYAELDSINSVISANRDYRLSRLLEGWDNILVFGWQSPSISPLVELEPEIRKLLPDIDWHLDKDNPYFIQATEVAFISMTIAAREIQWLDTIETKMQPIQDELQQLCMANH